MLKCNAFVGRIGTDFSPAIISSIILKKTLCTVSIFISVFYLDLKEIHFSNYEPVNKDTLSGISLNRTLTFAFFSRFPSKILPHSSIPVSHTASCDSKFADFTDFPKVFKYHRWLLSQGTIWKFKYAKHG